MSKRAEYMFALYEGSLADPGDRNPYAGRDHKPNNSVIMYDGTDK